MNLKMTEWHWTEMWIHRYWCNECSSGWDGNEWNGMNRCMKVFFSLSGFSPDHKLVPLFHGILWWFYSISRLISSSTSFLFIAPHLSPSCLTILSLLALFPPFLLPLILTLSSYPYPSYITSSLSLFAIFSPHHVECRKRGTTKSSKKWVPVHFFTSFASFLSQPITVSHIFSSRSLLSPSLPFPLPLPFTIFYFFSSSILLPSPHHSPDKKWVLDLVPDQESEKERERKKLSTLLLSHSPLFKSRCVGPIPLLSYSQFLRLLFFIHHPPPPIFLSVLLCVFFLPSHKFLILLFFFIFLSPPSLPLKILKKWWKRPRTTKSSWWRGKRKTKTCFTWWHSLSSLLSCVEEPEWEKKFSQILKWHAKAAWRIKILT